MRGTRRTFAAGLLVLALAACGGHNTADNGIIPNQPVVLKVQNDSFNDMRIYVLQGGQRLRLGTANGKGVSSFKIPKSFIAGITSLRFEAVPIGANGRAVSEEITISPGQDVELRIPPV